jgi:hypothetical protein
VSSSPKKPDTSAMMAVTIGQTCIGHVLARGKSGFEAFDQSDRSLGVFKTRHEAIAAIPRSTAESAP